MIRSFLRYLLYESVLSGVLREIVYFRWNKRYRSQEGFLSGDRLHAYLDETCIFQYHPEEKVFFKRPLGSQEGALPKQIDFYVNKKFTVSAGEVYEFDNAFLIGENAVGVTSDGQIILDSAMDLPNVLQKCSPRLLMNYDKLSIDQDLGCVISLVHIFCNNHYVNYFHWLTDSLILLEGWKAYESRTGTRPKVLINEKPNKFQIQYLQLIGVDTADLIYWKDYQKAAVSKLIVVKSRRTGTNMDEIVSPHGLRWMRESIVRNLPKSNRKYKKRIFLNRENAEIRRVLNFEELLPVLKNHDFEVVDTEGFSVAEQINLFQQMEFLFAIHGAGLTNMFFSEKLTILELIGNVDTPEDFQWYCAYYSMSQALGFDYSYLICEHEPVFDNKQTSQFYNIVIDPKSMDKRLNLLLNESGE